MREVYIFLFQGEKFTDAKACIKAKDDAIKFFFFLVQDGLFDLFLLPLGKDIGFPLLVPWASDSVSDIRADHTDKEGFFKRALQYGDNGVDGAWGETLTCAFVSCFEHFANAELDIRGRQRSEFLLAKIGKKMR